MGAGKINRGASQFTYWGNKQSCPKKRRGLRIRGKRIEDEGKMRIKEVFQVRIEKRGKKLR